jgi:hypothetical protein
MSRTSLTSVLRAAVAWSAVTALCLGGGLAALAAELRPTEDFADVAATVNRYVDQYGAKHVLLALDIDNTVMSMDNDLGSDHWFEWQNYLLKNEPDSPLLVAKDFPGLLEVQGTLYNLGHMHPPQPETPAIIARLQEMGIATILLTSRGPEFRVATERELTRCGYDIAATALPVRGVPGGPYLAYDLAKPERDGLTAAEIVTFKLPAPKPVSYANGLFMTAGQHKGIMMLTLLNDATRDIKAVVYVDDNVRHVGNVFAAAIDRDIDVASFHYKREDLRVQRFAYGDKRDVDARWRALQRTIHDVFVAKTAPREAKHKYRRCCSCCRGCR